MKRKDDSILNIKIKTRPVRMDKFVKYISSFVKIKIKGTNLTFVDKKEIIPFLKIFISHFKYMQLYEF